VVGEECVGTEAGPIRRCNPVVCVAVSPYCRSANDSVPGGVQGIVDFDEGEFQWTLASFDFNRTPMALSPESPTFLLAGGPVALLVSTSDCACWRLGAGEAVFRPAGTPSTVSAVADGAAKLMTISIARGPGPGAFTPGPGPRDIDLVRGRLEPDSALTVHAEVTALVFVTAGQVEAAETTVVAGATTTSVGEVTLVNSADEPATVVVAVVGPVVDPSRSKPPTSGAPARPAAPTTSVDSTTADIDEDGLTAADEARHGTGQATPNWTATG
jgi:hypothetical protein